MALDRAVEAYTPYLSAVVWNAMGVSASAEGSGFSVPVQELTERLGGTFSQDAAKGETACTYRGVTIVLQAGNETALVDGEAPGPGYAGRGTGRRSSGLQGCLGNRYPYSAGKN